MNTERLEDPNDLLRLCYTHKLRKVPISDGGTITGAILKEDLVRYLSRSEHFEDDLSRVISDLLESVDKGFLDSLRSQLRAGEIDGIPIVSMEGAVKKTITPGVLKAEQESEEFLERSDQLNFYETLFDKLPLPLMVEKDDDELFRNKAFDEFNDNELWYKKSYEQDQFLVILYVPEVLEEAFEAFIGLDEGMNVDIRELLEKIEVSFLKKAQLLNNSISDSAEQLELPRQTFNYRWNNKVDSSQDS
jgi:hypothetical protein